MKNVLLAGEGPTDIGDLAKEGPYRSDPPEPGVLQALVEKVAPGRLCFVDGVLWKTIIKYQAGQNRKREERNVWALALKASESKLHGVVFSRDRDRDDEQQKRIERGITDASQHFKLPLVGVTAVEAIEAWLLALLGDQCAERHSDPKVALSERGVTSVREKVEVVQSEANRIDRAEMCSRSLATWLGRLREVALTKEPSTEGDETDSAVPVGSD